jgi:hypothetical protein
MGEEGPVKAVCLALCAVILAACTAAAPDVTPAPLATHYPPDQPVYIVGKVYPIAVYMHCGISERFPWYFDGAGWTTNDSTAGMDGVIDVGKVEVTSENAAIYRSNKGPVLHLKRIPGPVTSQPVCF